MPRKTPSSGAAAGATPRAARRAPIIVGGCPRSGTTLLRLILDSHPAISCGPELKLLNPLAQSFLRLSRGFGPLLRDGYGFDDDDLARSFGRQIIFLLNKSLSKSGKKRAAEKTPQNVHVFRHLARMLPDSPLVHLIRDGRDVMCSLLKQRWIDPTTGKPMGYNTDLGLAAKYWVKSITDGRDLPDDVRRERYIELRYEAIVREPERELKRLFAFVGEPWEPRVLDFHARDHAYARAEVASHGRERFEPLHAGAIGRWTTQWSDAEKATVKAIAGPLLIELGYAADDGW